MEQHSLLPSQLEKSKDIHNIVLHNEIILGNLNKKSLKDIWNSEEYQNFRNMHITGNFPKGHKCVEKCDQVKLFEYLKRNKINKKLDV